MAKPTIILIHGMGQHTRESFSAEFKSGIEKALNLYDGLRGTTLDSLCDVVAVDYDRFFRDYWKKRSEESQSLEAILSSVPNTSLLSKTSKELKSLDDALSGDKFLGTHILDVLLYRFTPLGEAVRVSVGRTIADCISEKGASNVHVLGHSLGTAVAHDVLAKLYARRDASPGQWEGLLQLNPTQNRLASVHMIANVSRLLESFVQVADSVVKPGRDGCVTQFSEYRHVLDPVCRVKPFNPTDNGGWVSESDYNRKYRRLEATSVTAEDGNVHAMGHYLFNPIVHNVLFRGVFFLELSPEVFERGRLQYRDMTLEGVASNLQDAVEKLRFGGDASFKDLVTAFGALKSVAEKLGKVYKF